MRRLLLLVAAIFTLAGCAHKISPQAVEEGIVKGKTTKTEVLEMFGNPYKKHKSPGMNIQTSSKVLAVQRPAEAWMYIVDTKKNTDNTSMNTLLLFFDKEGVVSSCVFTEVPEEKRDGLIWGINFNMPY